MRILPKSKKDKIIAFICIAIATTMKLGLIYNDYKENKNFVTQNNIENTQQGIIIPQQPTALACH